MKNRNLNHKDDWATPPYFYDKLNAVYKFDFDPCPWCHSMEWDGLRVEWGARNFVNPPYSRKLKEAFVNKAVEEMHKGKLSVMLLPVSTSTVLYHDVIKPNATSIESVRGRIPFIGINSKGQYVNWHLWDRVPETDGEHVKNSGQHDSMIVVFAPEYEGC